MSRASDLRYGRQGGRIVPAAPRPAAGPRTAPRITPDDLARHLRTAHGIPTDVLDAHQPHEHAVWHDAEHRTRTPGERDTRHAGHLDHVHPKGGNR